MAQRSKASRFLIFAIAIATGELFAIVTVFRFLEVLAKLYLASLPAAAIIVAILLVFQTRPAASAGIGAMSMQMSSRGGSGFSVMKWLGWSLIVALILAEAGLVVNEWLDNSLPSPLIATVVERRISHGRHGSQHYHIDIASPVPPYLPWRLSDTDSLSVSSGEYQWIYPGRTTATLQVHKGFLGFPWYEQRFILNIR